MSHEGEEHLRGHLIPKEIGIEPLQPPLAIDQVLIDPLDHLLLRPTSPDREGDLHPLLAVDDEAAHLEAVLHHDEAGADPPGDHLPVLTEGHIHPASGPWPVAQVEHAVRAPEEERQAGVAEGVGPGGPGRDGGRRHPRVSQEILPIAGHGSRFAAVSEQDGVGYRNGEEVSDEERQGHGDSGGCGRTEGGSEQDSVADFDKKAKNCFY